MATRLPVLTPARWPRARNLSFHDLDAEQVDLVVISPNDPQAMVKYADECRELGIAYLYDPSQQIVRLSGEDLRAGLEGCDLDFELTDKILRAGHEIVEVPVTYRPRTVAEGKKIRAWDGLWALKVIIRDRLLSPSAILRDRGDVPFSG